MTKKTDTTVDDVLRLARQLRPDLYQRTEEVAKLIDPSAFLDDWLVEPSCAAELYAAKLDYLRAAAMLKAHEILKYLGVNTETDWLTILHRLAEERKP